MTARRFLTTDDKLQIDNQLKTFAKSSDIPTKTSQLTNDSNYANTQQVTQAITNAKHLKCEVVTSLPNVSSAKNETIYLKKGNSDYESYMLINGVLAKIGGSGNGAVVKEVTVQPSQWVNRVFTYNDPLITKTPVENNLIWNAPEQFKDGNDVTIANMRNAIFKASIVGAGQENGKAYLKCEGTVPTITIKMKVVIL